MRRGDSREEALRSELRGIRPPDEADALERAVELSAAERAEVPRAGMRLGSARRLLGAALAMTSVLVIALTPAGAAVRDWVGNAVGGGHDDGVRPALTHVPSGGSLLVRSGSEQFAVGDDGSTRLLGRYDSVAWSAQGLYIAAALDRRLSAIKPDGDVQWSIVAPSPVADQTWAPGCCRVGYRSDGGLWVVNGDGTDPHEIVDRVAAVAPAWMPVAYDLENQTSENVLAYVDDRGRVVTINADNMATSAPARLSAEPITVGWLDRSRVLAVEHDGLQIVDTTDGTVSALSPSRRGRIESAAVAPDGNSVALLSESGGPESGSRVHSTLQLVQLDSGMSDPNSRILFSGFGHYDAPLFSPDGSRIELGWREADQWRFISPDRGVEPIAIGGITHEFDGARDGEMPSVEGWCCS